MPGLKYYGYNKPSDKTLHTLRKKYQDLKNLIIDEISVTGKEAFEHLDLALKGIMQNSLLFWGVSLIVIVDFI